MVNIEVEEYVRTKDGIIDKVIIEYDGKCNNSNCSEKHISCKYNYYNEKNIVKHSKIISEVVNVGDYVNDKLIYKIDKGPNYCYLYYGKNKTFVDYQIKTILTKEQFEANCYKVGGKKWD